VAGGEKMPWRFPAVYNSPPAVCQSESDHAKAFCKKFENFEAAVALNFMYYDFVKTQIPPVLSAETAGRVQIVNDLNVKK
jgi:hypothetical protein